MVLMSRHYISINYNRLLAYHSHHQMTLEQLGSAARGDQVDVQTTLIAIVARLLAGTYAPLLMAHIHDVLLVRFNDIDKGTHLTSSGSI